MTQDYYEILQVHPRADAAAIEAAYARLRDLYDPTRLDGAADELVDLARQKRDAIERAYAVLAEPTRRAAYDASLAQAPAASVTASPANGRGKPQTKQVALDYRPLPPARRQERPRDFNAQPLIISARGRQTAQAPNQHWILPAGLAGLIGLVIAISLAVTNGSPPPAAPAPANGQFDQFEALIPQAEQAAQANANNPQAWINYGNVLYDSVQVVRETAPDSPLYQQRLPRWLQATEAYTRALALEPNNASARADLGASACFYGAGVGDQEYVRTGIAETRRAAATAPDDARVLISLGYCLVSAQPPQTQEALENWQRVVELVPADDPLATQARQLIAEYGQ